MVLNVVASKNEKLQSTCDQKNYSLNDKFFCFDKYMVSLFCVYNYYI
jgi:hypothetical protein